MAYKDTITMYNIDFKNIDEVMKLLRGEYPVHAFTSSMDARGDLPTDTLVVMRYYVYKDKKNKEIFEEALTLLMNGSDADLFLGFEYFTNCLYFEDKGKTNSATFSINRKKFLSLLRKRLSENLNAFANGVTYVNGETNTDALRRIKATDAYWKKTYGFGILE